MNPAPMHTEKTVISRYGSDTTADSENRYGMKIFDNIHEFWQMTWKRSLILTGICFILALIIFKWQIALGVLVGGFVLLGDIYLLKAPLDVMLERTRNKRHTWVMLLSLLRIIVLAGVLLVVIKFHIANIFGIFIGATLPMIAIISLLLFGGLIAWKV
jgi:ATP synthase I chain